MKYRKRQSFHIVLVKHRITQLRSHRHQVRKKSSLPHDMRNKLLSKSGEHICDLLNNDFPAINDVHATL